MLDWTGPDDMAAPNVSNVQAFSLQLTWRAPTQPNGVVVSFNIYQNDLLAGNVRCPCLCRLVGSKVLRSGTDLLSLVILFLLFLLLLLGRPSSKKPEAPSFQIGLK